MSWDGLFPAQGGSLMWPPKREHTQKLSNEEMVHNCLLAPNNLAGESHVRGTWHLLSFFHKQQPTMILDQSFALVCHTRCSPLRAHYSSLELPLIISGRIITLSSGCLGIPSSLMTLPLVGQPHVIVQVLSRTKSFPLQGDPFAAWSASLR